MRWVRSRLYDSRVADIHKIGRIEKERLVDAKRNYAEHLKAHDEFSRAFPESVLEKTREEIKDWNKDPVKSKNPYQDVQKKSKR